MKLDKRTTLLFNSDLWKQLENLAKAQHTSVGFLVREAVVSQYFLTDKERRLAAVEAMRTMKGPGADWKTMEREINEGRVGKKCPPR